MTQRPVLIAVRDLSAFSGAVAACWQAGAIPLLSPGWQPDVLDELRAQSAAVLTDDPAVSGARVDPSAPATGDAAVSVTPEAVAALFYTSGSTGDRKRIPKTFSQLLAEAAVLEHTFGHLLEGRILCTTVSPLHIYGFLFTVVWPLAAGRPLPERVCSYWEQIFAAADRRACAVVSSPAHLDQLTDIAAVHGYPLRTLIAFSSGGPLRADTARRIAHAAGSAPVEVYGSTETGGIAWRIRSATGPDDVPFTLFDDVEARCGEDGTVAVRSPKLADPDRFERTGDRGHLSSRSLHLLGRVDRIAKVAGKRVSLSEMEALLATVDGVEAVRVFPTRSGNREVLAAVVQTAQADVLGGDPAARRRWVQAARALLDTRFERVVFPRRWRFVSRFPQDSQSKTPLSLLEALVRDD